MPIVYQWGPGAEPLVRRSGRQSLPEAESLAFCFWTSHSAVFCSVR